MKHVADTSVIVGPAPSAVLGGDVAVSVITLAELRDGVLSARDARTRTIRALRLHQVRSAFEAVPVDEAIADSFGSLRATARRQRRQTKATDLLIIATAAVTGRTLLTRDLSQAGLARAVGVEVELADAAAGL